MELSVAGGVGRCCKDGRRSEMKRTYEIPENDVVRRWATLRAWIDVYWAEHRFSRSAAADATGGARPEGCLRVERRA